MAISFIDEQRRDGQAAMDGDGFDESSLIRTKIERNPLCSFFVPFWTGPPFSGRCLSRFGYAPVTPWLAALRNRNHMVLWGTVDVRSGIAAKAFHWQGGITDTEPRSERADHHGQRQPADQ